MKLICKHCFHSDLYLEENVTYVYPDIQYDEEKDGYTLNTSNALHAVTMYILHCGNCDKVYPKEVTEEFLGIGGSPQSLVDAPDLPPIDDEMEEDHEELILPSGWSKPS